MKLRGSITVLTLIAAAGLLLVACEHDTTRPEQADQGLENPYDWVGEKHNQCLDYTIPIVTSDPSRDWTLQDTWNLAWEYFQSIGDDRVVLRAGVINSRSHHIDYLSLGGREAQLACVDSLAGVGVVSELFAVYAKDLIDAGAQGDSPRLHDLTREVQASDLDSDEKAMLLSSVSVAVHSSAYWSLGDPGMGILQAIPAVVLLDFGGALFGAISSHVSGDDGETIVIKALIGAAAASTLGAIKP
jgi:hypothetical protein